MNFQTPKQRETFGISLQSLGIDIDAFMRQLQNFVDQMKSQGFSAQEIEQQLEYDQTHYTGAFQSLNGDLDRHVQTMLNLQFQLASNEPLAKEAKLVQRVLDPAAEHCDTCMYLASLPPMPYDELEQPGMQMTHGEDNCGVWCKCTVEVSEALRVAA